MKKQCIVSFASHGRENYNTFLLGLIKSAKKVAWDGDYYIRSFDGYIDEYLGVPIINGSYPKTERFGDCYPHASVPWGFKPYLIWEAYEKGARQIMWADSKIRLVQHPKKYFDLAAERGVVAFDNLGYPLKSWISDFCKERAGLTPEDLAVAKQIMGCLVIFDLDSKPGMETFMWWMQMAQDGVSFQNYGSRSPDFIAHRNDQSSLSAILHKMKIPLEPYGGLCYPPYDQTKEFGEPVFVNSGA